MPSRLFTRFVVSTLLAGSVCLSVRSTEASDATDDFAQAIGRVAGGVRKISDETEYGYNEGISLFGSFIRAGDATSLGQELLAGKTYAFLAGGDDDAKDIDLVIRDSDGFRVASDVDNQSSAAVTFSPQTNGTYTVQIKLVDSNPYGSFCVMAILRKGGWDVPSSNLVKACGRCITGCKAIADKGYKVRFHDERNEWCFFGGVLASERQTGLTNLSLGDGSRTFITAGDDHAQDLDLFLLNSSGNVIAKDDANDATPIFAQRTSGSSNYGLRVLNAKSDAPSLVVTVILNGP